MRACCPHIFHQQCCFAIPSSSSTFSVDSEGEERPTWAFADLIFIEMRAHVHAGRGKHLQNLVSFNLPFFPHQTKPDLVQCTAWCCEIGSLWTLDASEFHASVTSENQFHCTRLYSSLWNFVERKIPNTKNWRTSSNEWTLGNPNRKICKILSFSTWKREEMRKNQVPGERCQEKGWTVCLVEQWEDHP